MINTCDRCHIELPGIRPDNVIRRLCGECYIRKYSDKEDTRPLYPHTSGGKLISPRMVQSHEIKVKR